MRHGRQQDELLLVGDGSVAAAATWRALEARGFEVLLASTLHEALDMMAHNELAAVVLFGDNPARNTALLDRIRTEAVTKPVVVLTTVDDPEFDQAMLDHGADECVRHSALREDQLARVLHGLVEASRARDNAEALKETLKAHNRRLSRLRGKRQAALDDVLGGVREHTYEILTQCELLLRELRGPMTDEQKACLVTLRTAGRSLAGLADGPIRADERRHVKQAAE